MSVFLLTANTFATCGCSHDQWAVCVAAGWFLDSTVVAFLNFLSSLFCREALCRAQSFAVCKFICLAAGCATRGRVEWLYCLPVAQEGRKGREGREIREGRKYGANPEECLCGTLVMITGSLSQSWGTSSRFLSEENFAARGLKPFRL